jgi:hypothetical protein
MVRELVGPWFMKAEFSIGMLAPRVELMIEPLGLALNVVDSMLELRSDL